MSTSEARLDELDKTEAMDLMRKHRPDLTDEEFEAIWSDFCAKKAAYRQVRKFCEEHGEADFYIGKQTQLLRRLGYPNREALAGLAVAPAALVPLPEPESELGHSAGTLLEVHAAEKSLSGHSAAPSLLLACGSTEPDGLPRVSPEAVSALRWLLNITTEFDRKDVRTRQAARLLDDYGQPGRTNRDLLEEIWRAHATEGRSTTHDAPMVWPKGREVGRHGDMAPPSDSNMRVGLDGDNDVYVSVWDNGNGKAAWASIEFCNGGGGGGQSMRTREALIALMVAMEADNEASPHKAFPQPRAPAEPSQKGCAQTAEASKSDDPSTASSGLEQQGNRV